MSAQGDRLRLLEREVGRFHLSSEDRDQNHKRYLAEALQYLRGVDDPLDVLRFLDKLLVSPFAKRAQQKQALSDVGEWLGARLLREPRVAHDDLAYELGWMQRLVMIRTAQTRDDRAPGATRHGAAPNASSPTGFRSKIEAVEKRRAAEAASVAVRAKVEAPKEPVRVAPERLPDVFEAEFADLTAARDARKKAREREKAGKAKKVTWLALRPVDGLLAELAKGLACTLDTSGCDAVFDDIAKRDGRPRTFWVSDAGSAEGRLVVARITLERPA